MKKTLGGDRLGSGKKQDVEMHNYSRSTHDLSYIFRSTAAPGTLIPFMNEIALPGDTFTIDLETDIKTHPTIGPLFGSYKVQLDIFEAPIRLYQGQLHNNELGIGLKMSQIKLPVVRMKAPLMGNVVALSDPDNSQINPSALFAYLGIRGIGINGNIGVDAFRDFNAIPFLAYWDIYKNYYANKQEEIGVVVHTEPNPTADNVDTVELSAQGTITEFPTLVNFLLGSESVFTVEKVNANLPGGENIVLQTGFNSGGTQPGEQWTPLTELATLIQDTGGTETWQYNAPGGGSPVRVFSWRYINGDDVPYKEIELLEFPLSNVDRMRKEILASTTSGTTFVIDATTRPYAPYGSWAAFNGEYRSLQQTQEGLGIKTYQSDLFNNWISTEWIEGPGGISEITAIDTTDGNFTLDTLLLSRKVYDVLNRIAISGGSYDDWIDAVYTHDRYLRAETPMYMGGLSKELVFQEVISNSQTTGESAQPLGTLAGRGVLAKKHKGGHIEIKVNEPAVILGIVSITPRLDYSQGNDWTTGLKTMDDLHKPGLDEIGFQDLDTEQMAWWDTHWSSLENRWIKKSAGKQPAWMNYRTNVNRVRGNFAIETQEMFMVLSRRYTPEKQPGNNYLNIADLTTYIDPRKFNVIFADTRLDSQNFWVQIGVDMKVRRKISARIIPNL